MAKNNNTPRNGPGGYRGKRQNNESGYRKPIMGNSSQNNNSSQYDRPASQGNLNNSQGGADLINDPMKKNRKFDKSRALTIGVIIAGIVLCIVIIVTAVMLILERFKDTNPLAEREGILSKDTNSYELIDGADQIDDKREFTNHQIIEGQFTVLVLGFDESRELSDVMMLFLFDIQNKKLDILQIPRDSYVPDFTSDETGKINSVYTSGDQSLIPIQRTVSAVRDMFGIPIDRYVTTGCDDIVDIVDTIGGIPIDLPEMVVYSYDGYGNPKKYLEAGEQVLSGEQAELMVRARAGYTEGDIGRVKAQRIFMTACMKKALDMGTSELTDFIEKVLDEKLIATDMTLRELSILSDLATLIKMDDVTVQMVPGEGTNNEYGYSVWSIHKKATVDILNKYFRPYQVDLDYDDLPITELVPEGYYLTNIYDENQDTLQEIANGRKPGESKKNPSGSGGYGYSNDNSYDYSYDDGYDYYAEEYTEAVTEAYTEEIIYDDTQVTDYVEPTDAELPVQTEDVYVEETVPAVTEAIQ